MERTLITSTEQLKYFVPHIAHEKDIDTCLPALREAQENILIPLMGEELLDILLDYDPQASDSASASASASESASASQELQDIQKAKLRKKTEAVTAFYLMYDLSRTGDVHFTSMGLQSLETDTHKGAFEYQKRDVMKSASEKLDNAEEQLFKLLEKYKPAAWPEELRAENAPFFIRSASQFSKHCNIFNSLRTFKAMHGILEANEMIFIAPVLGETLFHELKKGDEINKTQDRIASEKYLRERIIPAALANLVMADALDTLSLRFNGDGYTFASFLGLTEKNRSSHEQQKDQRLKRHQMRAETYLLEITRYLTSKAELFPEFTPPDNGVTPFKNDPESNHFIGF